MPDQQKSRRTLWTVAIAVVIVAALGTMLLIGIVLGDDTDDDTIKQPEEVHDSADRLGGMVPDFHVA